MSRQTKSFWAWMLIAGLLLTGCKPIQPFYLGDHDDLAHYIDVATDLEYPDAHEASLTEVTMSAPPLSLTNPEPREFWDLTLEEAMQISLHNTKVLKEIGGARFSFSAGTNAQANVATASERLRQSATVPLGLNTVYDAALQETNVASPQTQGVEGALADFDVQLSTSLFWDRTSRPDNVSPGFGDNIFAVVRRGDTANFVAELSKRTGAGTQVFFRNNTTYEDNNGPLRSLASDWLTNFEVEARQPLMRGAGTQVNRVPIVLARIRTDISLADFECAVRDHVRDVENTYWEVYFAYRRLEAAKSERDSVHALWRRAKNLQVGGQRNAAEEAQARQRYFDTRLRVEAALVDLFQVENRLRFLMGLAPTDGRLIRPVDEPLNARLQFDWHAVLSEALCRNCELRIKRWQVKQRETELITARNQLLPQVDAVALYRWLGRGDQLLNHQDSPPFAAPNSDAFEELFHGEYQEWRLGVQMQLPVGFRRELAGLRNAQLQLAREKALLKETELEVVHALTDRVQRADSYYEVTETAFNSRVAAEVEVRTLQAAYETGIQGTEGTSIINLLLDALTRRANSQAVFYRTLVNYNTAVSEVHAIKGSLLEYNNILLAEGPWPQKAYFDALHQARKRNAAHYLDYGFTRPRVISRGRYEQQQQTSRGQFEQQALGEGQVEEIETPTREEIDLGPPEEAMPGDGMDRGESERPPQPPPFFPSQRPISLRVRTAEPLPQDADAESSNDASPSSAGGTTAASAGSVEIRIKGTSSQRDSRGAAGSATADYIE